MPPIHQVWAKRCTDCNKMFVVDEPTRELALEAMREHFHRDIDKVDFLQSYCKACSAERSRKRCTSQ